MVPLRCNKNSQRHNVLSIIAGRNSSAKCFKGWSIRDLPLNSHFRSGIADSDGIGHDGLLHVHFHQKSLQTQIWKSGHGSSCCQDPIERPFLQCRVTVGEAGNGLEGVTCVGVLLESLVTLVILNTCMHVPLTLPEITTQNDLTMSPQPFGLWLYGSQMCRLFDFLSTTRA